MSSASSDTPDLGLESLIDVSLLHTLVPELANKSSRAVDEAVYYQYLQELTACNVEQLVQQPAILRDRQKVLRSEMDDLAFNNYKVFLQSYNTTRKIQKELKNIGTDLDDLISHLPKLTSQCQEFCHTAQAISSVRQANYKMLKQHTAILELLELPQLMETCVKNHHYEEALELERFVKRLYSQHSDIPVIKDIMEDVNASARTMQAQLHQQLCGDIQLPGCLRVIGYLRRLSMYSDRELRITFLQCRTVYLNECLNKILATNPYNYLSKVIDIYRAQLSDISNHYRAIFDHTAEDEIDVEENSIISAWALEKITDFLHLLESKLLELTDGSSVADILSKAMYFGANMGRLGIDFRGLLVPIFERAVLNLFKTNLSNAQHNFIVHLRKNRSLAVHKGLSQLTTPTKRDPLAPPLALLDYPSLAVLTNGIVAALNDLKKCCPFSLQANVVHEFQEFLSTTLNTLKSLKRDLAVDKEERTAFVEICRLAAEELLPYASKCIDSLFKSQRRLLQLEKLQDILADIINKPQQ